MEKSHDEYIDFLNEVRTSLDAENKQLKEKNLELENLLKQKDAEITCLTVGDVIAA